MIVSRFLSKTSSVLIALMLLICFPVNVLALEPIDPLIPYTLFLAAPTNLSGSFNENGYIVLTWKDNSSNETEFQVSMQGHSGGGVISVSANTTTYTDTTEHYLGEQYQFKIRAVNGFGESSWSNVITLVPAKPAKPTDITAKFEADGDIIVEWNDNATNETAYEIQMDDGGSGGSLPLAANSTSYTDTIDHHIGVTYTFSVRAKNAFGESAWSNEVELTPAKPSTPNNVSVTLQSDRSAKVTWTDASNNESGFQIRVSDGSTNQTYNVSENATTYHNTTTHIMGKTYTYSMRAVNAFGESYWTLGVSITVPALVLTVPTAPSNLSATVDNDGDIVLSWDDNSNNETGFDIDMTDGSGGDMETVGANVESFTFNNPTEGKTYTFKVRAKNLTGSSDWSNSVSVLIEKGDAQQTTGGIFDGTQSSWAENEIQEAYDYGLTYPTVMNHYTQNITREEFCTIVVKLYEKLTGNSAAVGDDPFTDTSNFEILKAYNLGIVKGKAVDQFDPYANITREEICVMIMRCLQATDPNLDASLGSGFNFDDADLIHDWADTAMRFCFKNAIMKGVGGGKIAPLQNTQRQEAIVLLKRTFEKYN